MVKEVGALKALIAQLREDEERGCPWTQAQDYQSLLPQTLEELYELIDAVEHEDWEEVQSELGDLLYHILFYAKISEEAGRFDLNDIAKRSIAKHERRRPSADEPSPRNAEEMNAFWQAKKARLRGEKSVLDNIPKTLPALLCAHKIQTKVAEIGFDWPDASAVFQKLDEEMVELHEEVNNQGSDDRIMEEYGDLLFCLINLSRHLGFDPETALRKANQKFTRRFSYLESVARARHLDLREMDIDALEALWSEAKCQEE